MKKIMFVCYGNICRSPVADAILSQMIREQGYGMEIQVDSCGLTEHTSGRQPHEKMRKLLDKNRIENEYLVSEHISTKNMEEQDLIIAMDRDVHFRLSSILPEPIRIRLVLFNDIIEGKEHTDIKDPIVTKRFRKAYKEINEGCKAWRDYLIRNN